MGGKKTPSKVNFRRLAVLTLVFVVSALARGLLAR